jgi:hypothetical protein
MVRPGVEATYLRGIHWKRALEDQLDTNPFVAASNQYDKIAWGFTDRPNFDDDGDGDIDETDEILRADDDRNGIVDDIHEAGYGEINSASSIDGDTLSVKPYWDPLAATPTKYVKFGALEGGGIPLFSEQVPEPAIDGERNPGMMYQPMTRLANLVTTRSNVYAIWVTVGYFEVEKAPDWNDPITANRDALRARFGATSSDTDPQTIRGRALYDRVYPDGYMLGEELGTDTGNTKRQRAFYIIDRTEPVGFKPGEYLNVDKMIRVRRRIE